MAIGEKDLRAFLGRHRRIGLDTGIFIYQVQAHPRYADLTDIVFSWIEKARHEAVTSTITMTELLVQPYRTSDIDLVNRLYALLANYPHLAWRPPSLDVADAAARLRADHGLRTPDALQAATALAAGATGFVSNGRDFSRVEKLEMLVLEDLF